MSTAPDYFLEHRAAAIIAAAIILWLLCEWIAARRRAPKRNKYTAYQPRKDARDTLEFFKRRNSR